MVSRTARIIALVVIVLAGFGVVGVKTDLFGYTSIRAADRQRWEYLTVSYSQLDWEGDDNQTEIVYSNDPAYDQALFGELICPDLFDDSCEDLFRGMAYYLNLWGNDGWELVSVVDKSTSMYSVEMIFERPR